MLQRLGSVMIESDARKVFMISRSSSIPSIGLKMPIQTKKPSRQKTYDHGFATPVYNETGKEYNKFYLNYLNYFVRLLTRFNSRLTHLNTDNQSEAMDLLGKRIVATVNEQLKKHVNYNISIEYGCARTI